MIKYWLRAAFVCCRSSGQLITSWWNWRYPPWRRVLSWRWAWGREGSQYSRGSGCRYHSTSSRLSPLKLNHPDELLMSVQPSCLSVGPIPTCTGPCWLTQRLCARSVPSSWATLDLGSTDRDKSRSSLSASQSSQLSGNHWYQPPGLV